MNFCPAMIGATALELGRLGPINLRVELSNGGGDNVAVKSGIGLPEHVAFGCKGDATESIVFSRGVLQAH